MSPRSCHSHPIPASVAGDGSHLSPAPAGPALAGHQPPQPPQPLPAIPLAQQPQPQAMEVVFSAGSPCGLPPRGQRPRLPGNCCGTAWEAIFPGWRLSLGGPGAAWHCLMLGTAPHGSPGSPRILVLPALPGLGTAGRGPVQRPRRASLPDFARRACRCAAAPV